MAAGWLSGRVVQHFHYLGIDLTEGDNDNAKIN
jgi:hypothetical protein